MHIYIYIHRQHMVELSICDIFDMPIAILTFFLSFFFEKNPKMKEK